MIRSALPVRLGLSAVVVALAVAEIVRPTMVPAKRVAHPSLARAGGQLPLTHEQLDDLPPIVQPALGNIDLLESIGSGASRGFKLGGWCADPEAHAAGAGLLVIVDGSKRIDVSAGYGAERADVARFFANPAMLPVAFNIILTANQLGAGLHALRVAVVARDGRGIFVFPAVERVVVKP